ncbi:MAG: c-type cytochrome [Shimia sp.]
MAARGLIAGGVLAGAAALGLGLLVLWPQSEAQAGAFVPIDPDAPDLVRGAAVYAAECAACHGAELEGAPDWREPGPDGRYPAPPHDATGHTWHHDDAALYDYVALGGSEAMAKIGVEFDSGMPGYSNVLTEAEIRDVLAYIKSTWPERERMAQEERTAAAQGS